jgi:hypothetical protein
MNPELADVIKEYGYRHVTDYGLTVTEPACMRPFSLMTYEEEDQHG